MVFSEEYLKEKYDEKECFVCHHNFWARKEGSSYSTRLQSGIRPRNVKTCSKKCSRKLQKNRYH